RRLVALLAIGAAVAVVRRMGRLPGWDRLRRKRRRRGAGFRGSRGRGRSALLTRQFFIDRRLTQGEQAPNAGDRARRAVDERGLVEFHFEVERNADAGEIR